MNIAISGAASGIGKALADHLFLTRSWTRIYGLDQTFNEHLTHVNTDNGSRMYTVPGDVRSLGWEALQAYAACDSGGPIDVVVNNAGVNALSMIHAIKDDDIDLILDTNVKGYIKGLRAAAQWGARRVINIGSIAGVRPMRGSMVYCASKAAVDMLTKQAARELAPRTCVFGLNPGRLEGTEMTKKVDSDVMRVRGWSKEEADRYQMQYIPMQRFGTLEEVVSALCYLIYDAPEFQSGSIIELAGGQ